LKISELRRFWRMKKTATLPIFRQTPGPIGDIFPASESILDSLPVELLHRKQGRAFLLLPPALWLSCRMACRASFLPSSSAALISFRDTAAPFTPGIVILQQKGCLPESLKHGGLACLAADSLSTAATFGMIVQALQRRLYPLLILENTVQAREEYVRLFIAEGFVGFARALPALL
jgi:hypothetical protein